MKIGSMKAARTAPIPTPLKMHEKCVMCNDGLFLLIYKGLIPLQIKNGGKNRAKIGRFVILPTRYTYYKSITHFSCPKCVMDL